MSLIKTSPTGDEEGVSGADFLGWREGNSVFEQLAAYTVRWYSLTGGGEPERLMCGRVSADFFPLLGTPPALGRTFLPEEDRPDKNGERAGQVVVLSYTLWQRRFGSDPALIGKKLTIDGDGLTVVGIMPSNFQFPEGCELWMPLGFDDETLRLKDESAGLKVIARLKHGVTLPQVQAEMGAIARRLEQQHSGTNTGGKVMIIRLHK